MGVPVGVGVQGAAGAWYQQVSRAHELRQMLRHFSALVFLQKVPGTANFRVGLALGPWHQLLP